VFTISLAGYLGANADLRRRRRGRRIILIDLLLRVGREVDHTAAAAIDRGLSLQAKLIALSPFERDTILSILDDPPDGLVELRGVLASDHRRRQH
jgi:hypothetical protein